jgi:Transcription factor WhiB
MFASDIGMIHDIHTSRTSWHASAACRGLTGLMFASGSHEVARARAICCCCPAISECLAEADALACRGSEDDGIRGALTATERRARRQSTAA